METRFKTTVFEDDKCIVKVHKPILDEEELNTRKEATKKALVAAYKEKFKKHEGENKIN